MTFAGQVTLGQNSAQVSLNLYRDSLNSAHVNLACLWFIALEKCCNADF